MVYSIEDFPCFRFIRFADASNLLGQASNATTKDIWFEMRYNALEHVNTI